MEKQNLLISKVLETLYWQDRGLTEKDKKEFPLMYRAINAINEVWNSNDVPIQKMQIDSIDDDQIRMQVNESSPVTFIALQKSSIHA